ncbi:MAG: DUF2071 domain-containing protein, partial [Acidobacteria bacterium]|nr:DUF2071 domain-containing protein [Acidobacteriota bacterium]
MFHWLKRHPIAISAFFRHSLILTYAFPKALLEPLLPPGLVPDSYGDLGFVAIATVQTQGLRPTGLPKRLGADFLLTGYRILARFQTHSGRSLRGLRILRSDTDRRAMVLFGNLLTHYHYRKAVARLEEANGVLRIDIQTPQGEADLSLVADLNSRPAPLPDNSPFPCLKEAKRFAGPLPFTFDYEPETHSIVRIEGVRRHWNPQPVKVHV